VREAGARTLRVGGAVLVAVGLNLVYLDRIFFDSETFAARAAQSLGDPRVAGFLAERIADQAIAQKRDLTAYRPLIAASARTVVASEPFRATFRRAAQAAHALLFSESAERVYLALPDVGVLLRSALERLDPKLVARLPASLTARLDADADLPLGRHAVELMRISHRVRRLSLLGVGIGIAVLLAGVGLAPDRRRALLHAGAALTLAALVLFFLPPLLAFLAGLAIPDPGLRGLVLGVWKAFASGQQVWALVLAGVGLVFAAAASSLASHVEVERAAAKAWAILTQPARTRAGELGRALLLSGLGLAALLRPLQVLQALTVLVGALLAFEGLREIFALIAPRLAEAEDAEALPGARRRLRIAAMGALSLVLVVAAVLFLGSRKATPPVPAFTGACLGDPALCSRRLPEIVLAGAHNAMSAAEIPDWLFPNQERTMAAQLRGGIRALLFDVHYGTPVAGHVRTEFRDDAERAKFEKALGKEGFDAAMRIRDRLVGEPEGPRGAYLCHGFCELGAQPLVSALREIHDFLVEQPGEVLVLVIEDYVPPEDMAKAFEKSGLLRFVFRGEPRPPWPTLREMIDTDQRVLVLGENATPGVAWYHPAFEVVQETPYTFHRPEDFTCVANRGGTAGSLFQINHWIETTPTPKPSNAEIVNAREFLLARARKCQAERGHLPNILAVDFALTGDVVGAAAELNGLAARP
jgi:hypothetical protein